MQAKRNIGSQSQTDLAQFLQRERGAGQFVESGQNAGGVGASACHARFHGDSFFHPDIQSEAMAPGVKKGQGSPISKIFFAGWHRRIGTGKANAGLFLFGKIYGVFQAHRVHDHLHLVIAIFPPA